MSSVGVTVVEATGFFDVDVDVGGVIGADTVGDALVVGETVDVLGAGDDEPIAPGVGIVELVDTDTSTAVPSGVRSEVVAPCPVGVEVQPATTATVTRATPRCIRQR